MKVAARTLLPLLYRLRPWAYPAGVAICLYALLTPPELNVFGASLWGLFLAGVVVPFTPPVLGFGGLCDSTLPNSKPSKKDEEQVSLEFLLARRYFMGFADTLAVFFIISFI
jgi:hypothetical protein